MKKFAALILIVVMVLCLAACGKEETPPLGENSLNIGEAVEIRLSTKYPYEIQDSITDKEEIKKLTDDINSLDIHTDAGAPVQIQNYNLEWVDANGDVIKELTISRDDHSYIFDYGANKWVKADREMDMEPIFLRLKPIQYAGEFYDRYTLSQETLDWLELSLKEQKKSEYQPPEFEHENWDIVMTAGDITPTSITLLISQSEGAVNGEYELGAHMVEVYENGRWEFVPGLSDYSGSRWSMDAESSHEWPLNWDNSYGALSAGTYRVVQQFHYLEDTVNLFVEFEIE